jgi:hypothetical protein
MCNLRYVILELRGMLVLRVNVWQDEVKANGRSLFRRYIHMIERSINILLLKRPSRVQVPTSKIGIVSFRGSSITGIECQYASYRSETN